MRRFASGLARVLASRKFFVFIVVLLVAQAVWLALSFNYPMLWDEYYHVGLIQFYAHHLSPFLTSQPHSLDIYGNVISSPKYLYHYLMSFPFRIVLLFTHNLTAEVISLRFMNIALFAGGLVAWRAALLKISSSKALVHFVLLALVLLPLSSLLAAQVNYDNLVFLLSALLVLWSLKFMKAKKFEARWLALVVGVGLLACVVKLEIAPVFAALVIFLTYWAIRHHGKKTPKLIIRSFQTSRRLAQVGVVILLVAGFGLFIERFGVNLVQYHALQPGCSKVLDYQRCLKFSPYNYERILLARKAKDPQPLDGPLAFIYHDWAKKNFNQYFTTGTQISYGNFVSSNPLAIPFFTALAAIAIALVAFAARGWRLTKRPEIQLTLLVILALGLVLFVVNYADYRHYGTPWAIQGRYLLPAVPLFMLVAAMAVRVAIKSRAIKAGLASLVILGLLAGGGVLTDIIAHESNWLWPNQTVRNVNRSVQNAFRFLDYKFTD